AGDRATDDVLAVWSYVGVVSRALDGNALGARQRRRVDHIDRSRSRGDCDIHAFAVLAYRHVVGVRGELDLLDDLQRLRIDDVERLVRFVADIELRGVGRGAVIDLDPLDDAHHRIGGRVDQMHRRSSGIRLDDANRGRT